MDENTLKLKLTVCTLPSLSLTFQIQSTGVQSQNNKHVSLFKYFWSSLHIHILLGAWMFSGWLHFPHPCYQRSLPNMAVVIWLVQGLFQNLSKKENHQLWGLLNLWRLLQESDSKLHIDATKAANLCQRLWIITLLEKRVIWDCI